jgi:hypothetical protein
LRPTTTAAYQFASLPDFYSNATQTPNPVTGTVSLPLRYELRYAADGGDFPFADIRAQQYGLYAQDEILAAAQPQDYGRSAGRHAGDPHRD